MKAIENFFPAFAYPDINTRGVRRIRDSYKQTVITVESYANTQSVFYCLNTVRSRNQLDCRI